MIKEKGLDEGKLNVRINPNLKTFFDNLE